MGDVKLKKNKLREKILSFRRILDLQQRSEDSQKIFNILRNLPSLVESRKIHCFVGQSDEPDTLPILKWLLKKKTHLTVPCVDSQNPELQHSQLKNIESLEKGNYGIFDIPISKRIDVDLRKLQMILIPGIAFDYSGGRLGYGKGYYDRFLEKTNAFKIGLCFQSQVVEKVPMENHDICMNAIICEKGYHKI
jgi:5-formyltetrahydrofolate cyclo-ligase